MTNQNTKMQETTSLTVIITAAIAAIALSASYGCHQVEQTKRDAIKAGLVEKQNPGTPIPLWTKP